MIIGIDGNEANVESKVGISEYAYWLLWYFAKIRAEGDPLYTRFSVCLKEQPRSDMPSANKFWNYNVFGPRKLWTQFALPFHLFTHYPRPSVFFSPTHYAPRFSPVPTVVSVMDLSFLYFPELFKKSDLLQLKSWTAYSVKKAVKVLTISNSSKNDIMKEYNIAEERIAVAYPGIKPPVSLEPHVYSMNELQIKYSISDQYVLFVGTLQPRKNIVRLIQAFAQVIKSSSHSSSLETSAGHSRVESLELVIVGKKGWLYEEILEAPKKFGIGEKVKFLEFVPDEELTLLYKHAVCFVLPSLYEGFGLPVLEAMKHDCPVITSNVSSLPEAGGDAALYVDPENVDAIAKKIQLLVDDKKLRHELIEKGKKQVAKFSWEKTARETLGILEKVAGSIHKL